MENQTENQQKTGNSKDLLSYLRDQQFSEEELEVIKQCRKESFQAGTTYGVAGFLAPFVLSRLGLIKPHLGVYIGTGIFGYMFGKMRSSVACSERIMQLENSPLAENMRRARRAYSGGNIEEFRSIYKRGQETRVEEQDIPSKLKTHHHDTDTDSNLTISGLDDSKRPDMDSDTVAQVKVDTPPQTPSTTSYEELRRKNRLMDAQQRAPTTRSPVTSAGSSTDTETKRPRAKYNKYGDLIEDV